MKKKTEAEPVKEPVRITAAPETGLTAEQVKQRIEDGFDNRPVESPSKTIKEIVADNVFTYFNLLFVVIAVLLILVGSYRDLTFLPIIISNTLIGILQELRSKSVLDKLNMLNAPVSTVIRDGEEMVVPSRQLVLDDIAVFKAGDQISADAEVLSGNVSVNESLLTGESDEISKSSGDNLMSGSYVVSGSCRAASTGGAG